MASDSRSSSTLHLPEGLNYECVKCGRSCGEFWEIPVEAEMMESILTRPAEALAGARSTDNRIVPSPFTPGRFMMRQDEKGCCMQNGAGLCSLHAAFGEDAKPNVCRSFPYRFIETPAGTFTGISFACTAVLGNLGPPVAAQEEEVRRTHAFTTYKRRVEQPPDLTGDLPLNWEQYEKIEADLDELLAMPGAPIEERLVAQSVYLGMLAKFLRKARADAGLMIAEPEAHGAVLEHFRRQMRSESGDAWVTIRRIAGRRRRSPLLRRMCLGVAHELRNVYGRRQGRYGTYAAIFASYFRGAMGRGAIQLPGMRAATSHRAIEAVAFDPNEPAMQALLTRYFRHRLFRKDLLTADQLLWGHHLMMLHWGLIQWYAAAMAIEAGRERIALEELKEGLHKVEKFYVMHSNFDQLFEKYPLLRGFLDRMFGQPLYAFSMARGDWSG